MVSDFLLVLAIVAVFMATVAKTVLWHPMHLIVGALKAIGPNLVSGSQFFDALVTIIWPLCRNGISSTLP